MGQSAFRLQTRRTAARTGFCTSPNLTKSKSETGEFSGAEPEASGSDRQDPWT